MNGTRAWKAPALAIALAGALLPGLASCTHAVAPSGGPVPVIVDTDMSSDDVMALDYLLERRDVSVRAVTVEGTGVAHGPAGARNVLRLLRALGIHRKVPVGYGPQHPLSGSRAFSPSWRATADRMFGLRLPQGQGPGPRQTAVRLLVDTINKSAWPVVLVTLGPFTNLALALRADPGIAAKIKTIYAMAGAVRVAGNEPVNRRAEWNVYIDPRAAHRVLNSGVPITLVPLDATSDVPITPFVRDAARAHQRTAAMRIVATLLQDPYYLQTPTYFWDPLAAVAATDRSAVRLRTARLTVNQVPGADLGALWESKTGSRVQLAVSADAPVFERQFLSALNGGQPVTMPPVPLSQRLSVSFDGTAVRYQGPVTARAGQISIRLANRSPARYDSFELAIARLGPGRSLSDVKAAIGRRVQRVPRWLTVISVFPGPPGADPAWGIELQPGRYALVGVIDRDNALHALAELRVQQRRPPGAAGRVLVPG
jgi:inosine-uridine nucleoside N-ribohydrolase